MDIHGCPWISMDIPWISIDIHGYPWISMEVHGYPWASMDINRYPSIWTSGENRAIVNPRLTIVNPKCMDLGWIPIEFDRFSIRMGGELVGIDSKGNANTTYISELHPHIPAGQIFQKKGLPAAAARAGRRRPTALFVNQVLKSGVEIK